MAGDGIKMRSDLHSHPKIVRMASATKADRHRIVGGLHAVWCLFDIHSVDGRLDGYTLETLDDMVAFPGIAEAMRLVGWLEIDGDSLAMRDFETHNGQSAKRRANDAERKRAVRNPSEDEADKTRTREEKRREEKNTTPSPRKRGNVHEFPPGFDSFWAAYPRKTAKPKAAQAFARLAPDAGLLARMLAAVAEHCRSEQWTKDGGQFIPHPASWINAQRWEDQGPALGATGTNPWDGAH